MEMEEKQAQVCQETGEEALDAGEQEDFETLIRGKYKEEFDARVRKILDGRLRGMRQENLRLKEQQLRQKEEAVQRLSRLREQEGAVRRLYPEFCWQEELKNPQFGRLVLAGAEPVEAYETVHRQEHCCDRLRPQRAYQPRSGGHPEACAGRGEDQVLTGGRFGAESVREECRTWVLRIATASVRTGFAMTEPLRGRGAHRRVVEDADPYGSMMGSAMHDPADAGRTLRNAGTGK